MLENFMGLLTKNAPEFPEGYKWFNTTEPLSLSKLKGQVVILDFWTYACINCMHLLPVLSRIEEKFKDKPVIIIGVHSPKYDNEKNPDNVEQAIDRYQIKHPVIVDYGMHIWNEYFATAWPTTVVIAPDGKIAFKLAGEYEFDQLSQLVENVLQNAKQDGTLAKTRAKIDVPIRKKRKSTLSFPGKMSFSKDYTRFALSNSGNNRILMVDTKSGKILETIGKGNAALKDGKFSDACFNRPQGVLWQDDKIYVADTENHAIREIDLKKKSVKTIAGTGQKGVYLNFGTEYPARSTGLNSPWDLASDGKIIYIAMAGLHQIWSYRIDDAKIGVFSGRGSENITDGDAKGAEFAQPSGIWLRYGVLYVADSEVSSIRAVSTENRNVGTIISAGLFTYGDQSGSLSSTRLQHPLGISADDKLIYVADTYNSSIKAIDLKKGNVSNIVGNKITKSVCRFDDPECDSLGLYEPSDVKVNGSTLYIVDTNNHLVRTFNMKDKVIKTLGIK